MGVKGFQPHHEIFCRDYITEGNATQAYMNAFGVCRRSAQGAAHKLKIKPYIQRRIEEMRMEIKRKSDITFEKILNDYQLALEMARADRKPGEMVSAAREQAKLVGLLVERRELGGAGDFEQMDNVSEILEAVEKEVGPEVALALAKAFNVSKDAENEQKSAPALEQDAEALLEAKPGSDAVN